MSEMKVAVTGASGHVGNILCRELVKRGDHVKALVHKNEDDLVEMGAEIMTGNILNKEVLLELFRDVDVVYHLAAKISIDKKDQDLVYQINVTGTQNVIDACQELNVNKLVHFSSIHALQSVDADQILDESSPVVVHNVPGYESSKAEAERRVVKAASNGLNAVILSPTAIIGPYDFKPSLLGQALIKIYRNKLPMLVDGGYDFVDVRDVVNAAIRAAEKGRDGERYILSGNWLSLKELSAKIQDITGNRTPKRVVSFGLAKLGLPFIQIYALLSRTRPLYTADSLEILEHSNRNISNQKARVELGYNPRPIEDSIRDIFDWFQQNNLV